ncbi:MAG: GDSL-type esterase/lipase family protein [Verrucomicrobiota bacterium]
MTAGAGNAVHRSVSAMGWYWVVLVSASICAIAGISALHAQTRAADRAQLVLEKSWGRAFAHQKREIAKGSVDICFVGDSLTEFWASTGKPIWDLEFHRFRAVNLGMAADRTENILYRVQNLPLAAHPRKLFVVLAGTNNLSRDPPDSPATALKGVRAILETTRRQCPESTVLILSLSPNGYYSEGALRQRVLEFNGGLEALGEREGVHYLDIHHEFADDGNRWRERMTLDGTHFSVRGYDYLTRKIVPVISGIMSGGP